MLEKNNFIGLLYLSIFSIEESADLSYSVFFSAFRYKTAMGEEICKIRGFSLNYKNSKSVHFDALKDFVFSVLPQRNTNLVNPLKITRDKTTFEITSRVESKHYKPVYRKRVLQQDGISSLPYGW